MTAMTESPANSLNSSSPSSADTEKTPAPTVTDELRSRIDALDAELMRVWQERSALSNQIGAARVAAGGPRLVLSREQKIIQKFRDELGPLGTELAVLLLRAGRGRL